jgi:hypothetical protein
MTQNRKVLGMTPQQIAILAGLGALACVLFAVAGCFFLQGAPRLLAPAPQNTLPPQPTATLMVIPTLTPTETPTPLPYEMLIPDGWAQFKTSLIEIWMPEEFKKGDTKLLKNSTSLATPELVLAGSTSKSAPYKMLVIVSYEPMTAGSLDDYLTSEITNLPPETRVVDKKIISINSQEVVRFVFERRDNNVEFNDLVFVFLDGGTVWYVEYAAQINDYFTMLETFERSAQTFRIVR